MAMGRPPTRPGRGAQGLSLIEVVVVVVLLGILLALSLGGRSLIDDRRLAGAARTLVGDLRLVEQRARAERRCWRVTFDPAGEAYTLQFTTDPWDATTGCPATGWQPLRAVTLPSRIDLASTSFAGDTMTVSPFGNPNAGAVVLRTPGGGQRRVVVNVGGRVELAP